MIRLLMLVSVGLVISYGYLLINDIWPFEGMSFEQKGVFGDSWGAFTSVFSALGFCGVLWTIQLQIDSMRKIENDSKRRDESEKIRDFENSFFNMLAILQTIIKDMRVGSSDQKNSREGRAVFTYHYGRFRNDCYDRMHADEIENIDACKFSLLHEKEIYSKYFEKYFKGRSGNFSHYYRYLYNIFKFIDEAAISCDCKKKYANILRAQISNYELLVLFYNGNSKHGVKFNSYFEEYSVFDNLPVDKLISDVHVLFFNIKAWGDNADAQSKIESAKSKGLH